MLHHQHRKINDDYVIGDMLGEGAYSKVYSATSRKDGNRYACKVLDKNKLGAKDVAAVESEIAILKSLDHPNILHLIDHYDDGSKVYLVTELCEG